MYDARLIIKDDIDQQGLSSALSDWSLRLGSADVLYGNQTESDEENARCYEEEMSECYEEGEKLITFAYEGEVEKVVT